MNHSGNTILADLSSNVDPIEVAEPINIAPSVWKISRFDDVKTTLLNPQISISDLLSKNTLKRIQLSDDSIEKTMLLYAAIGRAERVHNDQSRIAAISISKKFSNSLSQKSINKYINVLNEEESPVEVMSKIIWPIINQWRCSIVDTTQDTCHKLDSKIWELFLASEKTNLRRLSKIEYLSEEIYELSRELRFPLIDGKPIKFEDWINPAFLALRPLAYTASFMLAHLTENEVIQRELRSSEHLRVYYIQEVERMMNSFRYIFRQVRKEDILIGTTKIPNGSNLLLDLVAANQDPKRWDNPRNIDFRRKYIKPASFGYGMLSCTGNNITNQFLHYILGAILSSFCIVRPNDNCNLKNTYNSSSSLRGYKKLYIDFTISK